MAFTFKKLGKFKPLHVEENGTLWASKGYDLFCSFDNGDNFSKICSCSPSLFEGIFSRFRLTARLMRSGFYSLLPFADGTSLAVIKGHILKIDNDTDSAKTVFRITKGSRPLNICRDPSDKMFWGEYFRNPNRSEVNIYCSTDKGDKWEIVYTFPKGSVRHIHGIIYDPFRCGYWILTGDNRDECRICYTKDFGTIETIVAGEKNCRAISLIPLLNGLIVPTDTPHEKNYIQWLDLNNCRFIKLHPLPNSAFFAAKIGDLYIISTAVEPSKVNKDRYSCLLVSKDGKIWKELYKAKKDYWNSKYFQFGFFNLPIYSMANAKYIFASGQALEQEDGRLLRWSIDEVVKKLA